MADTKPEVGIGKIFMNGRSQAVRIPKEFRLPGNEVRITRTENDGIVLTPVRRDLDYWFEQLSKIGESGFDENWRKQPPMPDAVSWDEDK